MSKTLIKSILALCTCVALGHAAWAQEAVIRKNIAERLPDFPKIDEVSKTPVPGLYELRIGNDVIYTDEQGHFLIEGQLVDTRTRTNLTEARLSKLTAIDFAALPLKDAFSWKNGSGARRLVVFADPNCGYCKRFETGLQQLRDVTVYTFLYPILGEDSTEKSRAVWCAKDRSKVWLDWMLRGVAPAKAAGDCDTTVLDRNLALGQKHRVNGTPAVVFEDGRRVPGAMSPEQVERHFATIASAKKK